MSSLFYIIENEDIISVISGTAKYSSNDSYISGYPFSNAYTYYDKPWLEWRSGYDKKNDHDIILNFSGSAAIMCIFNANFSYINYNSSNYALGYNYNSKDYRGYFLISGTNSIAFSIPAQETSEKEYFRIGSIVVATSSGSIGGMNYPEDINIVRPQYSNEMQNKASIIANDGRNTAHVKYNKKMMSLASLRALNVLKRNFHLTKPFVFLGDTTENEKVYLAKRLPDNQYENSIPSKWDTLFSFREIW